jgi:hypothetical protein
MKKIIATLGISCMVFTITNAQDLLTQVPSTATLVIKYSGENFSKNVPLQKLDRYGFIKDDFYKTLHIDTLTSLQNIGINFSEDIYQYVIMEDTCMSFVTLLNLKNEGQFLKLIKANYGPVKKIVKKKNFSFLAISETAYIGWNKNKAVIVNTSYQNRQSYYRNYYDNDSDTLTVSAPVSEADTIETVEVMPPLADSSADFAPVEDTESNTELYRIRDSINNLKWELWQQQQDMIARKQQQAAAEIIATKLFSGKTYSIENDKSYKKIIDPAAHISVWLNTETIITQYANFFNKGAYNILYDAAFNYTDTSEGFKSSVNMYFEKDKLRMEQKTYSADPKMSDLALAVMNSRQNPALINYINPDNIGYFSMSINSEAMANYYYTFLKKYLSNAGYMRDYAEIVDVYIDLLEIIIDEKGIAELLPGNYLFVMHDMKPQMVDYTDYEYDDEYNRTEVKKTRKELSPNFTFALETKKESFMEKVAHLPLKYAERGDYNYKEKDGYYELAFDTGKYPINSLYFMVKEGKVIVTTSKDVINMTINNTAFATDAETKNSILNNNYSLNINTKRLIEKLSTQFSTDVNKKITDYLLVNMGNLKMESRVKDGMIQGTTTLNITGNHSNSLEFFFNMMEAINNIIEQDKQEKEKTLY